jgi:hypothetical protein
MKPKKTINKKNKKSSKKTNWRTNLIALREVRSEVLYSLSGGRSSTLRSCVHACNVKWKKEPMSYFS